MLSHTGAILHTLHRLFKLDTVTHVASVELWVLLTTVLLVLRFVLDFQGPWFGKPGSMRMLIVLNLETLNQSLVIYTMGLMQLSGTTKVNDYFQVWAVLLVTLQYSVKIGRPYTRSKQVPLLDLMSSLWSANLLRVQTFPLLKIPLWTIWSLNAVRIIVVFVSSSKGETSNQESMRLVSEYMRYEDTLSASASAGPFDALGGGDGEQHKTIMSGYKYVVHGEHRVLEEVQDAGRRREGRRRIASGGDVGRYKIRLDPDGDHREKLVTVEKIWDDTDTSSDSEQRSRWLLGGTADPGNQLKDLCLSFALYKLLRRRFYDLPMHELSSRRGKEKMGRLVVDYVLGEHPERAFRITGTELSFLRDLFYSKHATMFAGGLWVPVRSLLLSLCLATATGYIAYPARYIPERMDPADRNRITHGVFITRLMVAIIVLKELLEIFLYVSSRWAKVLMLCKYVQVPRPVPVVVEWVMRFLLFFGDKEAQWDRKICAVRQQNLLVQVPVLVLIVSFWKVTISQPRRGVRHGKIYLTDYTKTAILDSIKNLKQAEEQGRLGLLDSYFSNAFAGSSNDGEKKVEWPCCCDCDLKVDTHIILVWHIATCLCEIYFFDEVKELSAVQRRCRPRPLGTTMVLERPGWYEQYEAAVSLSNYCVYLVRKTLVPDNRLVAWKVLDEVIKEINHVTICPPNRNGVWLLKDVYNCLMETVNTEQPSCKKKPDHYPDDDVDVESVTTTQGDHQVEEDDDDDHAGLWRDLATFWTGFLLHLAANTGAATHGKHLAGDTELITHLWALLTHAGFRGNAIHGEEGLDEEGIPDIDRGHQLIMKNKLI
ncbi:uncharacterized protein [Miscanthus floridulus]|uniref:uncharacterized protein n=1 Tax=Miscanthus floridulus TaxID=154761 RepID=UPI00345A1FEC